MAGVRDESYDAIVVGLGAMGSATAYQLAKRGAHVLGLEAFTPAHELGSSGGLTRIIRLAYFEHPSYVPLLKAAWAMWPEIEREANDHLLEVTGGLYIGRRGSDVLDGALLSAQTHGLEHEMLDADESRARFPALQIDDDMQTLHEPMAGLLLSQRCIAAHLRLAAGAARSCISRNASRAGRSTAGQRRSDGDHDAWHVSRRQARRRLPARGCPS